ncbi:MAG: pyridoxamine 5'-phosphate oxidase family protein [Acidimicrobiales bacterium]
MPSRRAQIKMTDEELQAFLAEQTLGVLGTVDGKGNPHLVNVTYLHHRGELIFSSFVKAQKIVNLQRNPRASMLIEIASPYHEIRGALVTGTAAINDDFEAVRELMAVIAENQQRRVGDPQPEMDLDQVATKRVIVSLKPDRIASWDHRRLGGVY